jgi:hypothetical protein
MNQRTRRMSRLVGIVAALLAVGGSMLGARATPTLVLKTDRILVTPDHRISEYTVDVDPTNPQHLILGAIDWDDPTGGIGCGIWTSNDGGRTWSRGAPIPGMDAPHSRADPWVAFAPNGDAHMVCLHIPGAITGSLTPDVPGLERQLRLQHSRSVDGGTTWAPVKNIPAMDPRNQRDKEAMIVTRSGRVLVCTNDYPNPADGLAVYRSDDNGATWLPPILVLGGGGPTTGAGGNCNGFAQGEGDTVHFVGFTLGTDGAYIDVDVFTSHDNGDTWTTTRAEGLTFPSDPGWTAQALSIYPKGMWPTIAVDPTDGDVVVASMVWDYQRDRFWSALFRSRDEGATFQRLDAPVPAQSSCAGCHLASPSVVYDAQGRLGLQMMMFSNDGGMTREQWLFVSTDDGSTWLNPVLVGSTAGFTENWTNPDTWTQKDPDALVGENAWLIEHPFDADGVSTNWAARSQGGVTHHLRLGGDYWDLAATDEGFLAMWNDHKSGYPAIWARLVAVT